MYDYYYNIIFSKGTRNVMYIDTRTVSCYNNNAKNLDSAIYTLSSLYIINANTSKPIHIQAAHLNSDKTITVVYDSEYDGNVSATLCITIVKPYN